MKLEHSFSVPVGIDEAWKILLDIEYQASGFMAIRASRESLWAKPSVVTNQGLTAVARRPLGAISK